MTDAKRLDHRPLQPARGAFPGAAERQRHRGAGRRAALSRFAALAAVRRQALAQRLAQEGIDYQWFGELGGRRHPRADSRNEAWRNSAFRGYADHLASEEFAKGLERLLALVHGKRTALMCAEVLWWRCHRALIADVLQVRGFQVLHIRGSQPPEPHPYTAPARLHQGRLSYHLGEGRLLNDKARQRELPL